ncbi:GNAT family N-acetyltransferase [Paenibacillus sp. JTLBN-2024]|uniref:Streptothricin acetyltransferase n=1 Tax=Paenibacillus cookii TaxID=157839 RepID=A0ABQ4LT27_9BACL|nr:GNAT family N-acetyltransferase [Paenibacillus cookii]KHF36407.1 TDP-fucosamine acetyltransferase [Paenibacillus sp. P1XP2]GIO66432.1 streptothricin acetyltransferase [Paenibacillus cookii]
MENIIVRKMTKEDCRQRIDIDDRFTVDSILLLSLRDNRIEYTVQPVPSYEKSYEDEPFEDMAEPDGSMYIDHPDQAVFLAFVENQLAGQIVVKRNWNEYACIEDIKVDRKFRRHGVGTKLVEQAKRWAKASGMPGLMLETQNNNVRACKFYERCGFFIGGFDMQVYKGINKDTDEVAMYWYYIF